MLYGEKGRGGAAWGLSDQIRSNKSSWMWCRLPGSRGGGGLEIRHEGRIDRSIILRDRAYYTNTQRMLCVCVCCIGSDICLYQAPSRGIQFWLASPQGRRDAGQLSMVTCYLHELHIFIEMKRDPANDDKLVIWRGSALPQPQCRCLVG